MLVMLLLLVATVGFAIFPSEATITTEKLDEAPLKYLPMRTEQWLERQRSTLPTSAQRLLDGIGQRLETLGPQLVNLDDASPAASERSEEHTSELQSLMRISYAVFGLKKKKTHRRNTILKNSLRYIDT